MKIFEIDAYGSALLLVKVDGDQIECLNAMNGWGFNIKDEVTITEKKEE